MVLTVNSGNETTVIGGFESGELVFTAEFITPAAITADEYTIKIRELLSLKSEVKTFDGAVVADVSDIGTGVIKTALKSIVKGRVVVIGPGVKTGLNIRIDNPAVLGANLVAVSVGAVQKYGCPIIVANMGTAFVFTVIDEKGIVRGGAIVPGLVSSLRALSDNAAELPQITLSDENSYHFLGTNTASCMEAGAVHAYAAIAEGFYSRYRELVGDARLVITGSFSELIARYCKVPVVTDQALALDGLYQIYKKNIK
jgi:type III pantothenate kinase